MSYKLRDEIRGVTIGNAWVSDATMVVIAGELDVGERVVAALTAAGGGNTLVATNRRALVATKRKVDYECTYDALTEVEAKTGFLTRGINLRSDRRAYMYRTGIDKAGPVEMVAVIRRLMAESTLAGDDDDGVADMVVAREGTSALARLASAYIGVATPSRAEIAAMPGLLADGEQVALIANCRRGRDYGVLPATDSRALFLSEGEDGVVASEWWPHYIIERVELGVGAGRGSMSFIQLHTAEEVAQIDALDINGARQAAEFLRSKAGESTATDQHGAKRPLITRMARCLAVAAQHGVASAGEESLTADQIAQLQSIEALRDSGILSPDEFERMRARIYETG